MIRLPIRSRTRPRVGRPAHAVRYALRPPAREPSRVTGLAVHGANLARNIGACVSLAFDPYRVALRSSHGALLGRGSIPGLSFVEDFVASLSRPPLDHRHGQGRAARRRGDRRSRTPRSTMARLHRRRPPRPRRAAVRTRARGRCRSLESACAGERPMLGSSSCRRSEPTSRVVLKLASIARRWTHPAHVHRRTEPAIRVDGEDRARRYPLDARSDLCATASARTCRRRGTSTTGTAGDQPSERDTARCHPTQAAVIGAPLVDAIVGLAALLGGNAVRAGSRCSPAFADVTERVSARAACATRPGAARLGPTRPGSPGHRRLGDDRVNEAKPSACRARAPARGTRRMRAVAAVAVTGVATAVTGLRFAKAAPGGAVQPRRLPTGSADAGHAAKLKHRQPIAQHRERDLRAHALGCRRRGRAGSTSGIQLVAPCDGYRRYVRGAATSIADLAAIGGLDPDPLVLSRDATALDTSWRRTWSRSAPTAEPSAPRPRRGHAISLPAAMPGAETLPRVGRRL